MRLELFPHALSELHPAPEVGDAFRADFMHGFAVLRVMLGALRNRVYEPVNDPKEARP